jgi:hypothetical protein
LVFFASGAHQALQGRDHQLVVGVGVERDGSEAGRHLEPGREERLRAMLVVLDLVALQVGDLVADGRGGTLALTAAAVGRRRTELARLGDGVVQVVELIDEMDVRDLLEALRLGVVAEERVERGGLGGHRQRGCQRGQQREREQRGGATK